MIYKVFGVLALSSILTKVEGQSANQHCISVLPTHHTAKPIPKPKAKQQGPQGPPGSAAKPFFAHGFDDLVPAWRACGCQATHHDAIVFTHTRTRVIPVLFFLFP